MIDDSTRKMLARADAILKRLPEDSPSTIVEVGVNRGQLGEHLLHERPQATWHGVDPWWHAPSHSTAAYVQTGDGHAMQNREVSEKRMREAIRRVARFGERAKIHRDASPAAAVRFAPASLDMVFLDADHSYEGVAADIAAWWPKVAPGGWLGGDDYAHPDPRFRFGVTEAVREFVTEEGLQLELDGPEIDIVGATWWTRKP